MSLTRARRAERPVDHIDLTLVQDNEIERVPQCSTPGPRRSNRAADSSAPSTQRPGRRLQIITLSDDEQQSEDDEPLLMQTARKKRHRQCITSDDEADEQSDEDGRELKRSLRRPHAPRVLFSDSDGGSSDEDAPLTVEFITEDHVLVKRCQIEDEGSWVEAVVYRHKQQHAVLWLCASNTYEGLDGSYSLEAGVLRDTDGDVIEMRALQSIRSQAPLRVNLLSDVDEESESSDEGLTDDNFGENDDFQDGHDEDDEDVPAGYMVCYDCKERGAADYIKHKDSFSAGVKRGDFGKNHTQPFCLQCSTGDQTGYIEKLEARAQQNADSMVGDEADEVRPRGNQSQQSKHRQHRRGERGGGDRAPVRHLRDPSSTNWFSEEQDSEVLTGQSDGDASSEARDEEDFNSAEEEFSGDGDVSGDQGKQEQGQVIISDEDDSASNDGNEDEDEGVSKQFRGMYVLDVPFASKEHAKQLGAIWQPQAPRWWETANSKPGCWCVPAGLPLQHFKRFDPQQGRAYLSAGFAEKDRVKQLGAQFDWGIRKWWVNRAHPQLHELFGRWL